MTDNTTGAASPDSPAASATVPSSDGQSGWAGWGTFAAVVLIVGGAIDAFHGLQAIFGPNTAYFITKVGIFQVSVRNWGWWHLILGLLLILIGVALLVGAKWARITAIVLVAINAIGQITLIQAQPWLSLAVLALDIIVIYALTVHGRDIDAPSA